MPNGDGPAPAIGDQPERSSTDTETQRSDLTLAQTALVEATARELTQELWAQQRLNRKRKDALGQFLDAVDFLVILELAGLYYLDTSTLLFLLRIATHVSPISSNLAFLNSRKPPSHSSIGLIILCNILAILFHLFAALPAAGEATRFDLHGHLFVDLIGQRCPTGWKGRLRFICTDLVVLGLQIVAVGIVGEMDRKGYGVKDVESTSVTTTRANTENVPQTAESEDGIELQPMLARSLPSAQLEDVTTSWQQQIHDRAMALLPEEYQIGEGITALHELDRLYSGQVTLMSVSIWQMMHGEYWERVNRRLRGRV